jgi:protein required for attachment to host cells
MRQDVHLTRMVQDATRWSRIIQRRNSSATGLRNASPTPWMPAARFRQLVVVASPDMLGALRGQLGDAVRHRVYLELSKDLTALDPAALAIEIDKRSS